MLKENPAPYPRLFSSAALDITVTSNDMQNQKLQRFVTFKQKCYDPQQFVDYQAMVQQSIFLYLMISDKLY